MSKCDCKHERVDDIPFIKADIGFQSRYSIMRDDYKPLVERVRYLERTVEALLDHLNLDSKEKVLLLVEKEV